MNDTRGSCSMHPRGHDCGLWKGPEQSTSCLSVWAMTVPRVSGAPTEPGFAAKGALDQISALQVLIQAQPATDSPASPGELKNTHSEETWRLRNAEREAQRKAARQSENKAHPCPTVEGALKKMHLGFLFTRLQPHGGWGQRHLPEMD